MSFQPQAVRYINSRAYDTLKHNIHVDRKLTLLINSNNNLS